MKINYYHFITLIFGIICTGVATQVYNVGGRYADYLFMALSSLGLTGWAFFTYFHTKYQQRKERQQQAAEGAVAGGVATPVAQGELIGDVDLLVKDAEAKILASKLGGGAGLSGQAVIFVLGDQGATKTTVIVNSGMEPELLSGQVYQQDNRIVPTRAANFWFAKKAVFVEAGGRLWLDDSSWNRLLKKLSPGKLKSVFGSRQQAPRAAVLCVDIERFLQPGAADKMATVARGVHARLNDISAQFGISFPVYVLFTKSDRISFFHDFVNNLSNEEATQVFGVTLPMRQTGGGVWAEEETRRLNESFNALFHSLCDKRIEYLPRENDPQKLPGCYEFPREFRKLRSLIVQFLVDIGRPSQLAVSPFVRGYYFTGVRPVIVQDVAAAPIFEQQAPAYERPSSATSIFRPGELLQPSVPKATPQPSGGRKVPQWVFLSHLFNDVILEDRAAMGASAASTKTSGLRRILLGLAALFALVWSVGMTVSYFRNRALSSEVREAAERLAAVRVGASALPSEDDLRRLKGLREKLDLLTRWRIDGPPWSYRWGLYLGDSLWLPTRRAYYNGFRQTLFGDTQTRIMLGELADPRQDCGRIYDTLRAYLITTSQWRRVEPEHEQKRLHDTLLARWSEKREASIGEARLQQASEEFAFYSRDLIHGNPYSEREDASAVDRARRFLSSCSAIDAIYARIINEANGANKSVNYNALYDWTRPVVVNNKDMPGAFTKAGFSWMRGRLSKDEGLAGEDWVLGPPDKYPRGTIDVRTLRSELWNRYTSDFIARWREYFNRNTVVVGYASPTDAANKLKIHGGTRAPILYLIGLASNQSAVEPADDPNAKKIREAFQWAHNVVPPGDQFIVAKNTPYVDALNALQVVVEFAAKSPNDPSAAQATATKRQEALIVTGSVARASNADLEGKLDQTIRQIMEKPITAVEGLFSPTRMLNAAAGQMCQQFNLITRKFPFARVEPEASVEELNQLLRPGSGKIWEFYEQHMKQFLIKQGNSWELTAEGRSTLNPQFANFFRDVLRLADALYRTGSDPRLNYSIRLNDVQQLLGGQTTSARLVVDGKEARMGGAPAVLVWTGSPSHSTLFEVNNSVQFNNTSLWSVFRFFADADPAVPSGGGYHIDYPLKAGAAARVTAKGKFFVDLGGAPPVFDQRFLSGLRCMTPAAR